MAMRRSAVLRIVAAVPLYLLALGCGGPVSQQNFEQLKLGMTAQQVQAILGKDGKDIGSDAVAALLREALAPKTGPDGKSPGGKFELPDTAGMRGVRWGDEKKSITVIYTGDRVSRVFKQGF